MDWVQTIGRDPTWVGLATIGGLVSLIPLISSVIKSVYRRRDAVLVPLRQQRRRRVREVAREFKLARMYKELGYSDLYIAGSDVRQIGGNFRNALGHLALVFFNLPFAAETINRGVIMTFSVWIMIEGWNLGSSVNRAIDKIAYATRPRRHFRNVKYHLRKASRVLV